MSIKKNTIWNLFGLGAPLLVGVVSIPYLYKHIGIELVGILTLIWSLIGYFSLFDFGLGRALTQKVSSLYKVDEPLTKLVIKNGLMITLFAGIFGGVVLAVLSYPMAHIWLKVSSENQSMVLFSILIASLGVPLTTLTTGIRGVLEAYEKFPAINILRLILGVANFGLPVLIVMLFGPSLVGITFSLIVTRFLILIAHYYYLKKIVGKNVFSEKYNKKIISELFSFGSWMTVTNIIGPLMVTADRFIISSIIGAGLIAYYTIPMEMLSRLLIIPTALTSAMFPKMAMYVKTDFNLFKQTYKKGLWTVIKILFPIALMFSLMSHFGLKIWLGAEFADKAWLLVCILALGIFINGIAFVPFAAIQSSGNSKITAIGHVLELIIYMPILFLLVHSYGLIGAGIAWVIRVTMDFIFLMFVMRKVAYYAK